MAEKTRKHSKGKKEQQTTQAPPAGEVLTQTPVEEGVTETAAAAASIDTSTGEPANTAGGNKEERKLGDGKSPVKKQADKKDKTSLKMVEFKIYVDLYKFFLRISLSVSVFFLSVVGGLLAIFSSAAQSQSGKSLMDMLIPPAKLIFLATPFIISCVLTLAYGMGAWYWWFSTRRINQKIREKAMEVELITRPFFHLLTFLLVALTFIFVFVTVLLVRMMAHYGVWFCQSCALG